MSLCIPTRVKPEHDIAIWDSCGLVAVEGISNRGKDMMKNQVAIFLEDSITARILPQLFDLYDLQIVYNPEL